MILFCSLNRYESVFLRPRKNISRVGRDDFFWQPLMLLLNMDAYVMQKTGVHGLLNVHPKPFFQNYTGHTSTFHTHTPWNSFKIELFISIFLLYVQKNTAIKPSKALSL